MAASDLHDFLDPLLDFVTSPQSSVDVTTRDRAMIEEELEKRLRHRVGRQDLVQRNILPPLSLPTAPKLFTQTQQLQRAKNADNLQKKLRNRPDRTDLQQLNILPDLFMNIDPGLQAKQVQLMKNKKVDSLNEKLANRPGPIQLIKDRILEPELATVIENVEKFSHDDDGSGQSQDIPSIALQRTASESEHKPVLQRHSIATSAPTSSQLNTGYVSPTKDLASPLSLEAHRRKMSDSSLSPSNSFGDAYEDRSPPIPSPRGFNSTYPPSTMGSYNAAHTAGIMSSGIGKAPSPSQTRKKQQKQQKYRKLRYHEYVPPTKSTPKGGKQTPKALPKSNNPYDLLLQQQQLYLQLQVMQQNGAVMQKLPDLFNSLSKEQKSLALAAVKAGIPVSTAAGEMPISLPKQLSVIPQLPQVISVEMPNKQNVSSVRFDDLKVSDLKAACKELGLIVSGKKAELVDRLLDANKRQLPTRALPDNSSKDSRRQAFSLGTASSVDSNPLTLSPSSPTNSPVFTFPSDQHNGGLHHSHSYTSLKHHSTNPPMRVESMPAMLPEVFPASTLQHEFEEMLQQKKRNYISQKGSMGAKSLAPCPDLNELVAIKLPSYPSQAPPTYQQSIHQKDRGTLSHRGNEGKVQMQGDKSARSLPSSPLTSNDLAEMMDDSTVATTIVHGNTTPSSLATTSNGLISQRSHDTFLVPSTPMNMITTSVAHFENSLMGNNNTVVASGLTSEMMARIQDPLRPGQMPVPDSMNVKVHPMNPPSYEASVQRSISLTGPHPQLGQLQHSSASFDSEVVGGDMNNLPQDGIMMDMDMAMDTGESFSDLLDIIKGDSTGFHGGPQSHPVTLPHHHTLNSHPHLSYTSPTKHTPRQGSDNLMLGAALNSQNPSLQKTLTGSDLCLTIPGQDGSRNVPAGSGSYNMAGNVMLGNELGWLDLENMAAGNGLGGFSPVFGNIGSQSNPGSLPQDQFQMQFMDDNSGHLGNNFMKASNPSLNGLTPGNDIGSFLDHNGILVQSDEKALLELGLSS